MIQVRSHPIASFVTGVCVSAPSPCSTQFHPDRTCSVNDVEAGWFNRACEVNELNANNLAITAGNHGPMLHANFEYRLLWGPWIAPFARFLASRTEFVIPTRTLSQRTRGRL